MAIGAFFLILTFIFCCFRFLREFPSEIYRFETTESCQAATPDRVVQAVHLASRSMKTLYIWSINFQIKFQRETVEMKQVPIPISDRKCQTMQMFIPKINVKKQML